MQTVSPAFEARTDGKVRKLKHALFISFEKDFDPSVSFFEIGGSSIGGVDILKGDNSVVQEWDKYVYEDYSDRVLQLEYDRGTEPPTNALTLGTLDLVLDNHDDLFTPGNTNSPLDGFLLPRRPVRIHLGFNDEVIPIFVGLTDDRPDIDERNKTAKFHCMDFLKSIMNISLDEELMYVDMRTDEIISAVLETAGLLTSQFDLDTGGVIIPFAYFKKGSKVGEALQEIAEAELGNISMDENGVIRFQNRTNWADNVSEWTFDKRNVLERKNAGGKPINVVEVYSQAREVQAKQKLWESDPTGVVQFDDKTDAIGPGETKTKTIDFKDEYGELPVTSADDPDPVAIATTSLYSTNELRDGTGDSLAADVALIDSYLFSTAMQLVFENTGSQPVYIKQLEVLGTPAKVANDIYIRETDPASIGTKDGFEEQVHKIENNYIQDAVAATSIAKIIIADRAEDDDQMVLLAKGVPQLQIGDVVTYEDENTDQDYFVTGINGILNTSGFRQQIKVSRRVINSYFRIAISTIGSTEDQLAP